MKTVIDGEYHRTCFTSQIYYNYKSRLFFWVCGGQWFFCMIHGVFPEIPEYWLAFCFMADSLRETSEIQMLFQQTPAEYILFLTLWFVFTGTGAWHFPGTHHWFQPHVRNSNKQYAGRKKPRRRSLYMFLSFCFQHFFIILIWLIF